jgi:surface protein
MGFMFNDCQSLEELDLSNFNTQKVKTMELMFGACGELKKLNLSNFNVSKADIH